MTINNMSGTLQLETKITYSPMSQPRHPQNARTPKEEEEKKTLNPLNSPTEKLKKKKYQAPIMR